MAVSEDKMREAFGRLEEVAQMADSQCYMNQEDVADFILAVEAMSDALTQQPESEPVAFEVGGHYRTQAGEWAEFLSVHNQGTDHETMADEYGIHRYTSPRRRGDMGRVTGTAHDYSDPRNTPPLYTSPQPWTELAASLYQACGAYDMPERILDVLSLAQRGEPFGHLIDGLLPCAPQPESEPVYVVVAGGIGPGEEFVEIENAQGESVGVPHSMDGDYRRIGPLYTGPQPTPQVPEGWRVEDEPEHSMITVHSPNGKAAILRDFDGSVGGMFLHFIRDLTAAPSIAEEREPKKSEGLHRNLYEMANQLIVKVGADGEICAKEKEFEQLYNAVLELEDAGPFRPEPPDGGEDE